MDIKQGAINFFSPAEIKDFNVMITVKMFFGQPIKMMKEHMIIFERLQLVKEMITQPAVY